MQMSLIGRHAPVHTEWGNIDSYTAMQVLYRIPSHSGFDSLLKTGDESRQINPAGVVRS